MRSQKFWKNIWLCVLTVELAVEKGKKLGFFLTPEFDIKKHVKLKGSWEILIWVHILCSVKDLKK